MIGEAARDEEIGNEEFVAVDDQRYELFVLAPI